MLIRYYHKRVIVSEPDKSTCQLDLYARELIRRLPNPLLS
jgi:hypothetical protein